MLCSGKVLKALFNGEVVAVKEMDIEAGAALAFVTEASRLQTLRWASMPARLARTVVVVGLVRHRCLRANHTGPAAPSSQHGGPLQSPHIVSPVGSGCGVVSTATRPFTLCGMLPTRRHSNIVSFYGVCINQARGKGLLVMEFCEGRDLHSVLDLRASGTGERLFGWWQRGRRIACEVARALNYLHSKSVVHLDVKGSNVLLSASGELVALRGVRQLCMPARFATPAWQCCGAVPLPAPASHLLDPSRCTAARRHRKVGGRGDESAPIQNALVGCAGRHVCVRCP